MLYYETVIPHAARDGALTIVLLHGRGSDERDLLGLARGLPSGAMVVSARAPFPGAPWGYGGGWAWYRFLGGSRPEPESFEESQRALGELLAALPELLPHRPGALALGGFSQGGTMSLGYALRNAGAVPMVLNFSGFLAEHPSVRVSPATVAGTRFFWGHGTMDPSISHQMAVSGRAALRDAGADLESRDYEIGHWIDPQELEDASAWLAGGEG